MDKRVYWIEEHPFLQELIRNILADTGMEVKFLGYDDTEALGRAVAEARRHRSSDGGPVLLVVNCPGNVRSSFSRLLPLLRNWSGYGSQAHRSFDHVQDSDGQGSTTLSVVLVISREDEDEAANLFENGSIDSFVVFDRFFIQRDASFLSRLRTSGKAPEEKRILIIEARQELRDVLSTMLSNIPNRWTICKDCVSALLELIQCIESDPYDVIICFQSVRDIAPMDLFAMLTGRSEFHDIPYSLLDALGEDKLKQLSSVYVRSTRVLISDDYEAQQAKDKGLISQYVSKEELFEDFSRFLESALR